MRNVGILLAVFTVLAAIHTRDRWLFRAKPRSPAAASFIDHSKLSTFPLECSSGICNLDLALVPIQTHALGDLDAIKFDTRMGAKDRLLVTLEPLDGEQDKPTAFSLTTDELRAGQNVSFELDLSRHRQYALSLCRDSRLENYCGGKKVLSYAKLTALQLTRDYLSKPIEDFLYGFHHVVVSEDGRAAFWNAPLVPSDGVPQPVLNYLRKVIRAPDVARAEQAYFRALQTQRTIDSVPLETKGDRLVWSFPQSEQDLTKTFNHRPRVQLKGDPSLK